MQPYSYFTLERPGQGVYKEKGSKFLAFAYPVDSEVAIRQRIDHLKKAYFDARHHCFAWILGPEKNHFRAFDDGEPNHSAGSPILGQIRAKGITNVLIVVVRYFGGVKLGVGGLVNAYKSAAEDALSNCSIVELEISEVVSIHFDYSTLSQVMKVVKDLDFKVLEKDFSQQGTLKVRVPIRQKEKLVEKLTLLTALGKEIKWKVHADFHDPF